MTRRILPLALLAATMSLTVCVAVQAASHGKPAQADTKHTPETVSPAVRWADSVSAANHQRYCDPNLSPDELMARLDAAPPGSYRTADALLNLPPDFRDKPVDAGANPHVQFLADMHKLRTDYYRANFDSSAAPSQTSFNLAKADRIRVIPVGAGCALSQKVGFGRNYLGDPPNLRTVESGVPDIMKKEELSHRSQLIDTQYAVRNGAVDEIYLGGVKPKDYMPPDYWVMFVSGLSGPFTLDAIAWWANSMSQNQSMMEAMNTNIAKKFPITVSRMFTPKGVSPTVGVANDLDSYYRLKAASFDQPPPETQRKLFSYTNDSSVDLTKSEALAVMQHSHGGNTGLQERSHICKAPKATCQLENWTPVGASCTCQYVTGRHKELQVVGANGIWAGGEVWVDDYADSNGKVISERN